MAKMTFKMTLTDTEWTTVAVGSSYSAFGIVADADSTLIFIGDTDPAVDEDQTLEISAADTRELALDLPTAMTLYARAERGESIISGYRVPV